MFQLVSPFQPAGDQPQAIEALGRRASRGPQTSGADGRDRLGQDVHHGQRHPGRRSGRRWSCRTTRRWPPSSTASSRSSFPHNAVHYFVSYYDYYQPEAYIPQRDIYIEKDASINQEIDRLRLAATSALVSRRDVIIVASVSCIYGLGSPEDYQADDGRPAGRARRSIATRCCSKLVDIQYERNDIEFRAAASSASAATASRSGRPTRSSPARSSSGATRSSSFRSSIPPAAR